MNMLFHTNLDEPRLPYSLGDAFDHAPQLGSIISIPYHGYWVELEVIGVRYTYDEIGRHSVVSTRIELHIPRFLSMSIKTWEERLRAMRQSPIIKHTVVSSQEDE